MKIPFDITKRPQIESGEYKVETRDGKPARILCWDKVDECGQYIVALVQYTPEHENMISVCEDGIYKGTYGHGYDLFIITPKPELTRFEELLWSFLKLECSPIDHIEKLPDSEKRLFHKYAAELLDYARIEFIKDGYIIEKKAFHDAVEKIDDKHKAEMSVEYSLHCKVENRTRHAVMNWNEFQKVAQKFIDIGKAEALRALPRWRKWGNGACGNGSGIPIAIVKRWDNDYKLVDALGIEGEQYIMLSDLEKLPGFKED